MIKKIFEITIVAILICAPVAYFAGQLSSVQQIERNQFTELKKKLSFQVDQTTTAFEIIDQLEAIQKKNKLTKDETMLLDALRKKGVNMNMRDFVHEVDELSKAMLHECPWHTGLCKKKESITVAQAIIKTAKKRKESIAKTVHHKVNRSRYFLSYHSEIPIARQREIESNHGAEYFEMALKILSADYSEKEIPTHWCNSSSSTCDWHKDQAKDKKKLLGYIDYANNSWIRATRLETTKAFSGRYSKHFFIKAW